MKNNKGFTVVELLSSFVLVMIIVVFLFEIVLELRNVYINEAVRTEIVNKNAILATALNQKLESTNNPSSISVTVSGTKVTASGRVIEYPTNTTLSNFSRSYSDGVYSVNFKIANPELDQDMDFNFVYYRPVS